MLRLVIISVSRKYILNKEQTIKTVLIKSVQNLTLYFGFTVVDLYTR